MGIVFITPGREDISDWLQNIKQADATIPLYNYPNLPDPTSITSAVVWNQPDGIFKEFPNLKWVSSLGAGVNHILGDASLAQKIVVTKIVDPELAEAMANYVLTIILAYRNHLFTYFLQKRKKKWSPQPTKVDLKIGILGLGNIGAYVADYLSSSGFSVAGFSRQSKSIPTVETYHGDAQLENFLNDLDVLVNLLPLTSKTKGFLNLKLFRKFKKSVYLINVARGSHLNEEDLLVGIDEGKIAGACLDVMNDEPLPEQHPFWKNDKIMITPHVASKTNPKTACFQIVQNYHLLLQHKPLINVVDRNRGY